MWSNSLKNKLFQSLTIIFSLLFHIGTFWALSQISAPYLPPELADIEIQYKPAETETEADQFVTDTEVEELKEALAKLKKSARFLSQRTKTVKEETVARHNGLTKNRRGQRPPEEKRPETSRRQRPSSGQILSSPQVVTSIGAGSTLSEYIPHVKKGHITALNTDQFAHYLFFKRVGEQLRPLWVLHINNVIGRLSLPSIRAISSQPRVVELQAVLYPNGKLKELVLQKTSGVESIDWAPMQSLKKVTPIINPPEELIEEDGLIRLDYSFHLEMTPFHIASKSK